MTQMYLRINDERVVIREIEQNLIILDVDTGNFMSAEGTGKFIVQEIQKGTTKSELLAQIANKYSCVDMHLVETDLNNFIQQLVQNNVIMEQLT